MYVFVEVYVHIHSFYVHILVHIHRFCVYMCVYQTQVSWTASRLLTVWATREAYIYIWYIYIYVCVCVCMCVCVYVYVCLAATGLIAVCRIFCCGVWASWVVVCELWSVVSRASCLVARPGIEPMSSVLQGRFLTIRPPDLYSLFMKGKAKVVFNWKKRFQGNTSLF